AACSPVSPAPVILMSWPSMMPGKISTDRDRLPTMRPAPLHTVQTLFGISPAPRHLEQVRTCWKLPKKVFLTSFISPCPLQVVQVLVPSLAKCPSPAQVAQLIYALKLTSFFTPTYDSSSVTSWTICKSLPR